MHLLVCGQRLLICGAVVVALVARPTPALPCTTFLMDGPVIGKSYDWHMGDGLVVINKRGVAKRALVLSGQDEPATWTSVYASVTFNQYGTEFPNSGMNEAGLVVEIMWLNSTQYPAQDERLVVNELQWIQHALDSFATVGELIAAAPSLRVAPAYADVHYLVCDAASACASFEYLGGELVIHSGAQLPVKTLTNDTYAASVAYLGDHQGFGGSDPVPTDNSSLARFVRASALALAEAGSTVSAFSILDSVSQGSSSQWNIVYMVGEQRAHFRTYTNPTIKEVALTDFDLDCTSPRMILDIDAQLSGDVSASFAPFDYATNVAVIDLTFVDLIDHLPSGTRDVVAAYPDAQRCTLPPDDDDDDDGDGDGDGGGGCVVAMGSGGSAGAIFAIMLLGLVGLATRRRR